MSSPVTPGSTIVRLILVGTSILVTAIAWLWMAQRSEGTGVLSVWGLGHHGSESGGFLQLAAMWQSMMIAMMMPTLVPWILTFERLMNHPTRLARLGYVVAFAGGYLVVWFGYSLAASAGQMLLQHARLVDRLGAVDGPFGGVLLVSAGVVQFAPLTRACLAHCRNPLSFFLSRWRDGPAGAFGLGLRHGAFCLGCCWALMSASFALGVMNVLWMAVLTLVVCLEQLSGRGDRFARIAGVGLAVLGLFLLADQR